MPNRSVLVASNYNAWREAFNGQSYACLNVIQSVEGADLLAPEALSYTRGFGVRPSFSFLGHELLHRSVAQLRRRLGLPRHVSMQRSRVEKNYDLFFFMCQFPIDLGALGRIEGWRKRSGVAVAYILESWSHLLDGAESELRLLDKFDHVFVLNAASIPHLARYTSTPCSHLAGASDCLLATPYPDPPERIVDIYSMGRRATKVHDQLVAMSEADSRFFYVYDTIRDGRVMDWPEHRSLVASCIKRSKFFVAFDPSVPERGSAVLAVFENALSTRYFEGAAGGAVMIGSAPDCPEFKDYFDWPDAVIEIPPEPTDMRAILAELNAQPERLLRARFMNATQSLRRHDWAHRWAQILDCMGFERSPMLRQRLDLLDGLARFAEAKDDGQGLRRPDPGGAAAVPPAR